MVSSTHDYLRDCYYIKHISRLAVHDVNVNSSIVDKGAIVKTRPYMLRVDLLQLDLTRLIWVF